MKRAISKTFSHTRVAESIAQAQGNAYWRLPYDQNLKF